MDYVRDVETATRQELLNDALKIGCRVGDFVNVIYFEGIYHLWNSHDIFKIIYKDMSMFTTHELENVVKKNRETNQ